MVSAVPVLAPVGFDIIGDLHGCAPLLRQLLEQLGYSKRAGVYQHATRQALFVGDLIDRGPHIRETLHLVRDMVERGSAQVVLGNHELNALAYHTPRLAPLSPRQLMGSGDDVAPNLDTAFGYLRARTQRHQRQLSETLAQFADYPREWSEFLDWFMTLPLVLEREHPRSGQRFRVVHACWDAPLVDAHLSRYGVGINAQFLQAAYTPGTLECLVRRRLTSGIDLPLPEGLAIRSREGQIRRAFRAKFWDNPATTYAELAFQPDPLPAPFAAAPISAHHRNQSLVYPQQAPLLFVGHYWLRGRPAPLADNLACVDYSAVKGGRLVAYQLDDEPCVLASKFSWVEVAPAPQPAE